MNQIMINKSGKIIDICIMENGVIHEKYLHDLDNESILGNIYAGVVSNVVEGMEAAFVDIGEEKNAFMPVKDALPKVDVVKEEALPTQSIAEVVKVGDKVLVQVRKEPISEKGARVSTHITFPGNYLILMPETDIITISQKIEDENKKEKLKTLMKTMLPKGFGVIIRTDAEEASEEELKHDLEMLLKKWKDVMKLFQKSNGKELIYNDHELASKVVRDLVNRKTEKIICNSSDIGKEIQELVSDTIPVEFVQTSNLFEKFGMLTEMEDTQKRKIWLKCGGYIAIDKTEALTAIDVNSGKYTGKNDLEATALKVNEEAAVEIMKQIRLKDIGGIIVIDYIDMVSKEAQEKVLAIMHQEAKKDRSKIDIKDFTKLNLVEMTRKKMYV